MTLLIGFGQNGFDATAYEPSTTYEPLPDGWYESIITASEIANTKSGSGQCLTCELQIVSGEYKGRKFWDRFNLFNKSDKAQAISRSQLSALCHAAGVLRPRDTIELHNRPIRAKVACRKLDDGSITNEVKGYKPIVQTTTATPLPADPCQPVATVTEPTQQAPTQAQGGAPWQR